MIKSWLQFINESKSNDNKIWKLSKDDILEYFIELIHHNYIIDIQYGFAKIEKNDNKVENVFEQKVLSGETVTPAYFIKIKWNSKTKNNDLTDDLHFAYENLKELVGYDNLFGAEIEVLSDDRKLDINDVKLKGGAFIDNDTLAREYLALFVIENKTVKMNSKMVCDYYGWKYDDDGDGVPKAHVSVEEMANLMLHYRSPYKELLINGIGDDEYWPGDYRPDTFSLFTYILNSENVKLAIKALSKEFGGIKNLLDEIDNENLSNKYEKMSDKSETTENDLIDLITEFLTKERFKILERICDDSEIISEIKMTCAYWEMDAVIEQNNKELWDEFISIVDDEIGNYEIIYKEVKKYYKSSEGKKEEYKEKEKFFSLPLNNKWIEELEYDYDTLSDLGSLKSLFEEWASNSSFGYELNPNFSSYGNVDINELNNEIKEILKNYLKN